MNSKIVAAAIACRREHAGSVCPISALESSLTRRNPGMPFNRLRKAISCTPRRSRRPGT